MDIKKLLKRNLKGKITYTLGMFVSYMIKGVVVFGIVSNIAYGAESGGIEAQEQVEKKVAALEAKLAELEKQLKGGTVGIGSDSKTNTGSVSIGASTASADFGVAVGIISKAQGKGSVTLGVGATTADSADFSLAFGAKSNVADSADFAIAVGPNAYVGKLTEELAKTEKLKEQATEVTNGSEILASPESSKQRQDEYTNSIAIGNASKNFGFQSITIGSASRAFGENEVSIGAASRSYDTYGIALGGQAISQEAKAISIGGMSNALGEGDISVGYRTETSDRNSIAVGEWARSSAKNSVALGAYSHAAPAIDDGFGVKAGNALYSNEAITADHGVVSVGSEGYGIKFSNDTLTIPKINRRIIGVGGAIDDNDAVNLAQLKAVATATGLSQDDIKKINSQDSNKPETLVKRIDGVNGKVGELENRVAGQKTVFTADNYAEDNSATKLETSLGTPIEIVSGDFEGPKVTTNGSSNADDKKGTYKKENIAVNIDDEKVQIGLDTKLTGMQKFQTKIEKIDTEHEGNDKGYNQHILSNNGFVSRWYADEDGSMYNNVSATLRASNDPIHQGLVISSTKNGMPMGTATYNLGYTEIAKTKADFSGQDIVKMDPEGLYFQDGDFSNSTDVIALTKATEGKKSALTFKLDENSKGTGEINGLANGKISDDSTQAINGSQLKGFADKIGLEVDKDNNSLKAPELTIVNGETEAPETLVEGINKVTEKINKGFNVAAAAGTPVIKNLGDTVTIKNGDLTDSQYVGKNLSTEIKEDGNLLIGMKGKPEFGGVIINRDSSTSVNDLADNEVLTKGEIVTKIDGAKTEIKNNIEGVSKNLQNKIKENTDAIAGLKDTTNKAINDVKQEVAANKIAVENLGKEIAKKADQTAVEDLGKEVAAVDKKADKNAEDIAANKSEIAKKADQTAVEDLGKEVAAVDKKADKNAEDIAANKSEIAKKADQTAVEDLGKELAKKVDKQAVTDLGTRVQTAEDAIAVNTENIEKNRKKIDDTIRNIENNINTTGINNKIAANKNKIEDNEKKIKANEDKITKNTTEIDKNKKDIAKNKDDIVKNKDEIAKVKDKADKNEKNIETNTKAIANHENRIRIVEAQTTDAIVANREAINQNSAAIRTLNSRMDHLNDKLNKGMALMSAMTTVDFQDVNPGEMGIGAGIGSYGNSQGVAVGVAYSPSENFRINAKYSVSTSDIKTSAVGVGAVYKFKVR